MSEVVVLSEQNKNSSSPSHNAQAEPERSMSEVMVSEQNRNSSSTSHNAQADDFKPPSQPSCLQRDVKEDKSSKRNALLTISVLIGTATYQAVINPPGGVWQDDKTDKTPKQIAGASILAAKNPVSFGMFMICNTIGYSFSMTIIEYLTRSCPLGLELRICLFVISFAYGLNLSNIVPQEYVPNRYQIPITLVSLFLPYVILLRKSLFRKLKRFISSFSRKRHMMKR